MSEPTQNPTPADILAAADAVPETQAPEPVVMDGRPLVASDVGVGFLSITIPVDAKTGKSFEWKPGDVVWRPRADSTWRRWEGGTVDPSHLSPEAAPPALRHRSGVVNRVHDGQVAEEL